MANATNQKANKTQAEVSVAARKVSASHLALAFLLIAFMFFIGATNSQAAAATAAFTGLDTATQGNWAGKYGSDGYAIANSTQSVPSYASFALQNQLSYTWAAGTSDSRAPQVAPQGRVASCWDSLNVFTLDVNLTDGKSHQVAVYALDWDGYMGGRAETLQVVDATSNAVLDTRSISTFEGGVYLLWNVTGHVHINVTMNSGVNSVISGIFFATTNSPATSASSATASFKTIDTTTSGNWQGKYGVDGYSIPNSNQLLPSYATFSPVNQMSYTWAAGTSDSRAPQTVNPQGRIASCWDSLTMFSFDVNLTDGQSHQVAIYALDWDGYMGGRSETLQVVDAASNTVLDTRSISSFTHGTYLVWNITGHVRINAIMNSGVNSVVSGIFFGGASNNTPAVSSATAPAITSQPASQKVTAGQSATFSVADTGTAPLTYQWMKNGVAISGAISSSYTTPAASTSDNNSQFTVVVGNPAGSATSSAAALTVNAGTLVLNASAANVSFGSVNVSNSNTQTVTLTNAGTGAVTITNISLSGAGFNASGVSVGTILNPGQTAAVVATFSPSSQGASTGSITVSSNATSGAKVIALSGTGIATVAHTVSLSWSPSTSTVAGYNVYVSIVSGSSYVKLTSSPVQIPDYSDSGLQTAQTRYYVVTSVNSNNQESTFSEKLPPSSPNRTEVS